MATLIKEVGCIDTIGEGNGTSNRPSLVRRNWG